MNDRHNTRRKVWVRGAAPDRRTWGHPELRALPSHPPAESWIFFNELFMDQILRNGDKSREKSMILRIMNLTRIKTLG